MDGAGARALRRAPRDRTRERPVQLERSGAVAVAAQLALVAGRKPPARQPEELARDGIGQDEVGARQLVLRARGADLAAELDETVRERVGDPLRAAARKRPAAGV